MQYRSTRGSSAPVSFSAALQQGLAPDGGLYVPARWPQLSPQAFANAESLPDVGANLLAPFAAGDPLAAALPAICAEAFNFAAPLVPVSDDGRLSVLELFHGPTAAFKDFGARFLAACLSRARAASGRELNILVATSGDTGGAVAAAFHRRPGFAVSVLYPAGLVSPTQERQLTCWGENVRSFRVAGTFDDCQRLVKQAFVDPQLKSRFDLSSANSINLGRLLPQAVHFAATSLTVWRATGEAPSFVVPAGNLGHAVACIWARQVGLPIDDIVLAHNANRTVPDFLASGDWRPRASVATLASAMDVGNPSNFERLQALFPELADIRAAVRADSVDDAAIANRIKADFRAYAQTWCPHTAAAAEVYARMAPAERAKRWVVVATAHPAKFREIVEPLLGVTLPVPATLAALFERPSRAVDLPPDLGALRAALAG
jgi:threonine synthase